jgi:peptidoglycan/LPS O-acetylase OafA/YrhL
VELIKKPETSMIQAMTRQGNNLDLLRHMAATLVLWSHSFSLSASSHDPLGGSFLSGALGVNIFFAISGFLISESWFRRNDTLSFIEARLLRIMPALIASVLLSAFVIGPLLTSSSLSVYLTDWRLRWFVVGNISMFWMVEELPYLFSHNPHPLVVNGSLWTLPKEATMYGLVLAVGLLSRWRWLSQAFIPIFTLAFVYATWRHIDSAQTEHALSLVRVSRYFIAGAVLGQLSRSLKANALAGLTLGVLLLLLPESRFVQAAASPLALAFVILAFARMPLPIAISGRWKADISYGLYVYGYTVQQVIFFFYPHMSGYIVFGIAFLLTAFVALISWFLLEKPALSQRGQLIVIMEKLRPRETLHKLVMWRNFRS